MLASRLPLCRRLTITTMIDSAFGVYSPQIKSKADLMRYCLETTARRDSQGKFKGHDRKKALTLFVFFTSYVTLPDVEETPEKGIYSMLQSLLAMWVSPPSCAAEM